MTDIQSINRKMEARLAACGLPSLEIQCYGRQITVETKGRETADRWARVLARFATVRGVIKSVAYNKENKNTCLLPSTYPVWRVYARIGP